MATKHDEFKVYYFSFDEDEISKITAALRSYGDEDLADEIYDQIYDGSSVSVESMNGAPSSANKPGDDPARCVTIHWDGTDWMRDEINGVLDEIYGHSKNGRCVGGLEVSVDTSELDAALKSARELADIMKSCGLCEGNMRKFMAVDPKGKKSALFKSESDALAWANFCKLAFGVYSMEIVEVE